MNNSGGVGSCWGSRLRRVHKRSTAVCVMLFYMVALAEQEKEWGGVGVMDYINQTHKSM